MLELGNTLTPFFENILKRGFIKSVKDVRGIFQTTQGLCHCHVSHRLSQNHQPLIPATSNRASCWQNYYWAKFSRQNF